MSTNISYGTSETVRSNVVILAPGADGKISVRNGGTGPIDLILDIEGWFSVTLPPAHRANCGLAGSRAGDKGISHALTDRSKLVYSPVTGNMLATGQLLTVAGIDQDNTVTWRYNSINDARPTISLGYFDSSLIANADGSLTNTAPDGGCYKFPQVDATHWGTSTSPAGINALIHSPSTGTYDLTFYPSGLVYEFTDNTDQIYLHKAMDKYSSNPNTISYSYANGHLVTITDTRGKTMTFAYTDTSNPTQPSKITDDSLGRSVTLNYDGPSGAMSKITDATGAVTSFGYNSAGLLNSITDDRGTQTSLTYGSDKKATGWTYATGTADASAWTAAYPSATQAKITDPNSHTATYNLDSATNSVKEVIDANNHKTTSAFDPHDNQISNQTSLGNTTSYTWGPGNNMLTSATSPAGSAGGTGASASYTYPGSGSAGNGVLSNYQPSASKDAQGNSTTYGYSTARDVNSVTTPTNSDGTSSGGTPTSHRQGDTGVSCGAFIGELCSSTNGNGKTTSYTYDALGRVTVLNRPAPLGAINFTYDAANRVTSATDGRGNTAYYSYDADDRQTQVSYSASSCPAATCVTYTYDGDGNKTSRVAATGTTGYGYDRLNRPTSKTFNLATVSSATYDGASNMTSFTDAAGTVHYTYDAGNQLVLLAQPGGSCPTLANIASFTYPNSTKCTEFHSDNDNRRDHVYYPNGQRIILAYFNSGRVKQIQAVNTGGGVLASRSYTYANTSGADTGLRDSATDDVAV